MSFLFGGESSTQKANDAAIQQNATANAAASKFAIGQATPLLTGSTNDFNTATSYYNKLLSSDPNETNAALAPERNRIANQYNTALTNSTQFSPRGGGRNALLQNYGQTANAQSANALLQLRPQAAGNIAQIGATEGGLGTGLLNSGAQINLGTSSSLQNQNNYLTQQKQLKMQGISSLVGQIAGAAIGTP